MVVGFLCPTLTLAFAFAINGTPQRVWFRRQCSQEALCCREMQVPPLGQALLTAHLARHCFPSGSAHLLSFCLDNRLGRFCLAWEVLPINPWVGAFFWGSRWCGQQPKHHPRASRSTLSTELYLESEWQATFLAVLQLGK